MHADIETALPATAYRLHVALQAVPALAHRTEAKVGGFQHLIEHRADGVGLQT